jgi:hypothetical protein
VAETKHPFLTMVMTDPVHGEQVGWHVEFQGRRGYAVIQGEYLWYGRIGPAQQKLVQRVGSGAVQGGDLIWGHEVFPTEMQALLAAEYKNDLVLTLIAQRNEQHAARLRRLGFQRATVAPYGCQECDRDATEDELGTMCGADVEVFGLPARCDGTIELRNWN